jgi:hypothetical protein
VPLIKRRVIGEMHCACLDGCVALSQQAERRGVEILPRLQLAQAMQCPAEVKVGTVEAELQIVGGHAEVQTNQVVFVVGATVVELRLNNEFIVVARGFWVEAGWWPPAEDL